MAWLVPVAEEAVGLAEGLVVPVAVGGLVEEKGAERRARTDALGQVRLTAQAPTSHRRKLDSDIHRM